MKSINIGRIASALTVLAFFATSSFAAINPLANPYGMAVDAKGNLWVANTNGGNSGLGNILVFSPGYALLKKDIITSNLKLPIAVAFDPLGNLWVANVGASNGGPYGSVAEYINGVQNPAGTITDGIVEPQAMAIDNFGNIWVQNQQLNITTYSAEAAFSPPTTLVGTVFPIQNVAYGIAVTTNGLLMYGQPQYTAAVPVDFALLSYYTAVNQTDGIALACDTKGNTYIGNSDGSVDIFSPTGNLAPFVQLSFVPTGIAVDNLRGRVYISDAPGNVIYVYSTAGVLLHTIQ